jgi:hypothetical protein
VTIIDTIRDPHLFAAFFKGDSWKPWIVALKAIFGLPMDESERDLFVKHTGRETPPTGQAREGWFVVGRRGGKSRIAALVAVYLSCFRSYKDVLAPGERGVVMLIACDRQQAKVLMRYIVGFLEGVPMLARLIVRRTEEEIDLSNGITIAIHTSSYRAVRGYTIVAAILDEIAFWRSDESANPDIEVVNALKPAMSTVEGSMLIAIGSPYSRRGIQYQTFKECYAKDDSDVLVWKAATREMNSRVPQSVVDRAYAQDPASASAEYGAEFRSDLEAFVSQEVVEAAVVLGRRELPPVPGVSYTAFVDPSGGSGGDSFTVAIAHFENERHVLDAIRERRGPLSPDSVIREYAAFLKGYGVHSVTGDRYSAQFVVEAFSRHGIKYTASERTKSELYLETLPLLNSGRLELLDDARLVSQSVRLERRTSRGGKDSVDHPPGSHDDVANAAAGALVLVEGVTEFFSADEVLCGSPGTIGKAFDEMFDSHGDEMPTGRPMAPLMVVDRT